MQSSADSIRGRWTAIAGAVGAGAYAFPLIAPWHPIFLIAGALAGGWLCRTPLQRWMWAFVSIVLIHSVLSGNLSSPLAAASVSAIALGLGQQPAMGVAVLALNLSFIPTLQSILAEPLSSLGLEPAAPALIAIAMLWLASPRSLSLTIAAAVLVVGLTWVSKQVATSPDVVMMVAAIPPCIMSAILGLGLRSCRPARPWLVGLLFVVNLVTWGGMFPKAVDEVYVMLPQTLEAPEKQFFDNYVEALRFAGINAIQVSHPDEIPEKKTLLLPWLTSNLGEEPGDATERKLLEFARERQWTVVAAGEHTNLGGVTDRLARMSGVEILRNDLTVPRRNTDDSGPLHSADMRGWRHEAILNRGASVRALSVFDKVIIAGDGWWAEPNIGEWLWVGDYIWRKSERSGRLPLAVATSVEGARWVVVGDNSFLINNQIYADPRPTVRLLELASLWPSLAADLFTLCLAAIVWSGTSFGIAVIALLGLVGIAILPTMEGTTAWRDFYIGQTGFDDRNFNTVLAEAPDFLASQRLIRQGSPIRGQFELPQNNALIFGLIDGTAYFGETRLDRCRRLGSLQTSEGPMLMDAQVCRVSGEARVLIGDREAAAAIVLPTRFGQAVVILDNAFLAQRAPAENKNWLLREIGRWKNK